MGKSINSFNLEIEKLNETYKVGIRKLPPPKKKKN